MTAVLACSTFAVSALGESAESQYVSREVGRIKDRLQESRSVGMQAVLDDLQALADECASEGWDGYQAQTVSAVSILQTQRFIRCLPLGAKHPSLGVDANGWVTLEWGPSARWTLSLSLTDDGWIHYAGLFGSERVFGTIAFTGRLPTVIVNLIRRSNIA